jgi:hypothetical protein
MVNLADIFWQVVLFGSCFGAGYLVGRDHGRWEERITQWRRRDAEWDAEHLKEKRDA